MVQNPPEALPNPKRKVLFSDTTRSQLQLGTQINKNHQVSFESNMNRCINYDFKKERRECS